MSKAGKWWKRSSGETKALLADVWRKEIDATAKRVIRHAWVHGMHFEAAEDAIIGGASESAIREALDDCEALDAAAAVEKKTS